MNRLQTPAYTHRFVARLLVFMAAWCLVVTHAQAHLPDTSLIDIKQRFLRSNKQSKADIESVDSFRILKLMIGGNVYQTEKHANYCFNEATGKYDFKNELKYVQPLLGLGDITMVNMRTSFGDDITNMFSAPDEFALQMKNVGINAVMHANLHTANVSKENLNRTRKLLNSYDMFHTGSFTDNNQRNGNYPLIINKKGFRIAVLNYTSLLTRPAISRDFIINEFDKSTIERDLRMARINQPDFILVYFDWGNNQQIDPTPLQIDLAQFVFQRGANMVVGTHPNLPARIDLISYMMNGELREGICAYSLGNLIASNDEVRNRNGFLLDIELKKNNYTHTTAVNDWGVIPVYTHYDTSAISGKTNVLSVPCWAVENGEILPKIPYIEKRRAANSAYEIRKLVGNVADEIQYNLNELIVNNVQETIGLTSAPINNKFSVAHEEDIEPTEPPVLPVATIGSNNPPSLAMLYEDPNRPVSKQEYPTPNIRQNETAATIAARKEAQRTNSLSAILATTTVAATVADLAPVNNTSTAMNTITAEKKTDSLSLAVKSSALNSTDNRADSLSKIKNGISSTSSTKVVTTNSTDIPSPENNTEAVATNKNTAETKTHKPTNGKENNPTTASCSVVNNKTSEPPSSNPQSAAQAKAASNEIANAETANNNTRTWNGAAAKNKPEESENGTQKSSTKNIETSASAKAITTNTNETFGQEKKKSNTLEENETPEAKKKRIEAENYAEAQRKNQAANTSYRSTGKEYELNSPEYRQANKPKQAETIALREREQGIDISSKKEGAIGTGIRSDINADMAPVRQANLTLLVDTFYRIQFYALKKFIPLDTNYYTHLKGYEVREEEGLFKYMLGKFKTYEECEKLWKGQILPRYKQSFIIKYVDGKRKLD